MRRPTTDELRAVLGRSYAAWAALTGFVYARYRVQEEWVAEREGWLLRMRKGGRALLTLSTRERYFRAQFVVPPGRLNEALALDLSEATRRVIRAAHPYPDGRWITLAVRTLREIADLKRLLMFKAGAAAGGRRPAA